MTAPATPPPGPKIATFVGRIDGWKADARQYAAALEAQAAEAEAPCSICKAPGGAACDPSVSHEAPAPLPDPLREAAQRVAECFGWHAGEVAQTRGNAEAVAAVRSLHAALAAPIVAAGQPEHRMIAAEMLEDDMGPRYQSAQQAPVMGAAQAPLSGPEFLAWADEARERSPDGNIFTMPIDEIIADIEGAPAAPPAAAPLPVVQPAQLTEEERRAVAEVRARHNKARGEGWIENALDPQGVHADRGSLLRIIDRLGPDFDPATFPLPAAQAPAPTLNCYHIDDGATHYVAAASHTEALRVLVDLEMLSVTHWLVPDEKVDDLTKIEQSEDAAKPDGYTLREALDKARREGKAQLLSTSEF